MRRSTTPAAEARSVGLAPIRAATAVGIGIVAATPIVALLHDLPRVHPPRGASWLIVVLVAITATVLVGRRLVGTDRRIIGSIRAPVVVTGAAVGALPTVLPLLRLLSAPIAPVEQLAWTLGEEDNAQIVGLAREVITDGPGGGVLADQYGTGAVVMATTLLRMTGLPASTIDPRLIAIHAFTFSALLAALTLTAAIATLVIALTDRVGPAGQPGLVTTGLLGAATSVTVATALTVTVMVPMRTGFLTFVWALAWSALGVAVAAVGAVVDDRRAAIITLVSVAACGFLVVRSWPFIGAVLLPPILVSASRLGVIAWVRRIRRRPLVAAALAVPVAAGLGLYLERSALGEVLSYGVGALTISASTISLPAYAGLAAALAVVAVTLVGPRSRRLDPLRILVVGPTALGWVSWAGLGLTALVLTGGELNYGGMKLAYGVVGIAFVSAVPAAMTVWYGRRDRRSTARALVALVLGGLLWAGGPAAEVARWDQRLAPSTPPHAREMIEAVLRTSPEVPIRCRPQPGTVVSERSRLAAYFCVRWVEDALNDRDRDGGKRGDFLTAPEGTFDAIVAEATEEGLYDFAYIVPLGPGWFGWDGSS